MISHDPWDVTHKEAITKKWVCSPKEAIAECNRMAKVIERMREALQKAVEWIEDDRADDDYIIEEWYHEAKAALRAAERTEK